MTNKAWMPVLLAAAVVALAACPAAAKPPTSQPVSEPEAKISNGQAVVLGIVEGITEYLPVSSTGHMILASAFMGISKSEGLDAFEIVIQLGAILAVLGLYRRRVGQMCRGLIGQAPPGRKLFLALILAFLPAGIVGLLVHRKIEEHLFGTSPVIAALIVGGLLMILVEHYFWRKDQARKRVTDVAGVMYWQALVIGMAQCLAMWPGTSRSMITMITGLVVGLDMITAAEFSFLLALPTLGAATVYSGYKHWDALKECAGPLGMAIGLVISAIVAAIAVKGFVKWLTRHGMVPFGIYRILLGAGLFVWFVVLKHQG